MTGYTKPGDISKLGLWYTLPRDSQERISVLGIKTMTLPLSIDIKSVCNQMGDFSVNDLGNALDPYLDGIAAEMKNTV